MTYLIFPVPFETCYGLQNLLEHDAGPEYANTYYNLTNTSVKLGASRGISRMWTACGVISQATYNSLVN